MPRVCISINFEPTMHITVSKCGTCFWDNRPCATKFEVVSSGGALTPAGTSVFTKHNWDMGMVYLSLNGWRIYGLLGWTFMT